MHRIRPLATWMQAECKPILTKWIFSPCTILRFPLFRHLLVCQAENKWKKCTSIYSMTLLLPFEWQSFPSLLTTTPFLSAGCYKLSHNKTKNLYRRKIRRRCVGGYERQRFDWLSWWLFLSLKSNHRWPDLDQGSNTGGKTLSALKFPQAKLHPESYYYQCHGKKGWYNRDFIFLFSRRK